MMTEDSKMPFLFRRIMEYTIPQFLLSFIFVKLIEAEIIPETLVTSANVMIVCMVLYSAFSIKSLIDHLFYIKKFFTYFVVNIAALAVISIAAAVMAYMNLEPWYTYLFFQYKLFYLMGASKLTAVLYYALVNLGIIIIIPPIMKDRLA